MDGQLASAAIYACVKFCLYFGDLEAEAFHQVQLHFCNNGAVPAINSTSDAVDLAVAATLLANFLWCDIKVKQCPSKPK